MNIVECLAAKVLKIVSLRVGGNHKQNKIINSNFALSLLNEFLHIRQLFEDHQITL